jgi:hypothetical protein
MEELVVVLGFIFFVISPIYLRNHRFTHLSSVSINYDTFINIDETWIN